MGIGTARLDALVLLEDVTSIDRARLLAEPTMELSVKQEATLQKLLSRRAQHEPLAYIRRKTEFYGREFVITPAVLEPRPESETMIDNLLNLPKLPQNPWIADVGTGSGALGITAKLELPMAQVELLDISAKALEVAQSNVDLFTPGLAVILSDLLAAANTNYDVLLCNLPYVPDNFHINTAAGHEPQLALFGGPDGLNVYRKLFSQVRNRPFQPLYILTECLPPQHASLVPLAITGGYAQVKADDFIQVWQLRA